MQYPTTAENPKDVKEIIVDGRHVKIYRTLYRALENFHRMGDIRRVPVWADQVCINQADLNEQAAQVAIMGKIFGKASTVRIFLCKRTDKVDRAIMILQRMASNEKIPLSETEEKKDARQLSESDFADLTEVFFWKWWERLWTLQESAVARHATLFMGNRRIKFRTVLHLAQGILRSSFNDESGLYEDQTRYAQMHDIISLVSRHDRAGHMITQRDKIWNRKFASELTRFFEAARTCRATRDRDYVFALLGLLPDAFNLTPDYHQPLEDLYEETTRRIVELSRSLDIVRLSGPLEERPGGSTDLAAIEPRNPKVLPTAPPFEPSNTKLSFPSWVVDFRHTKGRALRTPPGMYYDACDGLSTLKTSALRGQLHVMALSIGILEIVDSPSLNMWDNNKQDETKAFLLKWSQDISGRGVECSPISFWNTILIGAVRVSDRHRRRSTDEEATDTALLCEQWLRTGTDKAPSASTKLPRIFDMSAPNGATKFFTLDRGHFGVAQECEVGDIVAVLAGLDFPAVVRAVEADQYQFVGCCFVDGMLFDIKLLKLHTDEVVAIMGGEAVRARRSSGANGDGWPDGFQTITLI